jgi:hypothetical protein
LLSDPRTHGFEHFRPWLGSERGGVGDVRLDLEGTRIVLELRVDSVEVPDRAFEAGQFHVRDAGTGRELHIDSAKGTPPNVITLMLASGESLDYPLSITVSASGLAMGGAPVNLDTTLYNAKNAGSEPSGMLKAADGKDDSRYYFNGQIAHTRGSDVTGTYDLKIAFQNWYHNTNLLQGPIFTLQGGNDPKGDPDSMTIGWNFSYPMIRSQTPGPFLALAWENSPHIESTRDFTYTNFVWSTRFKMISRSWTAPSGGRVYFRPYGGFEYGKNLASEVAAARDQTVIRPLIGSTFALVVPLAGDASFSATGEYIRRWPVRGEVLLGTDKTGNVVTTSVGTQARDDFNGGVSLNFTKYAGVKFGYERGSVPPAFKFVDNQVTFGLVIKVK